MEKLNQVYDFLTSGHHWNEAFQISEYRRILSGCGSAKARITALLHMVAHTQSSPKLEALAAFWQHLESAPWESEEPSLAELTEFIRERSRLIIFGTGPWDRLFLALSNVEGWGPKTAALFVKCTIKPHRSSHKDLHFLRDANVAEAIGEKDRLYLPVDAVIRRISRELSSASLGDSFHSINKGLRQAHYTAENMLIWDDLWFWDFFSQNSRSIDRTLGWNPARFWGLLSTPKTEINVFERKCDEFLGLLAA